MFTHLSSAKKTFNLLLNKKQHKTIGTATKSVKESPAVITPLMRLCAPSARYFVISLLTVMGVPEQVRVNKSANTESAT